MHVLLQQKINYLMQLAGQVKEFQRKLVDFYLQNSEIPQLIESKTAGKMKIKEQYIELVLQYDNDIQKNQSIQMKELFDDSKTTKKSNPKPNSDLRTILIKGGPGSGKSILMRRLAYDWAELKKAQQSEHEFLFRIDLRNISTFAGDQQKNEQENFILFLSKEMMNVDSKMKADVRLKLVQKILQSCDRKKIIMLLDGYDEVFYLESQKGKQGSNKAKLLKMILNQSRNYHTVITTRPTAVQSSQLLKQFQRVIEIQALTQDSIKMYIDKFFESEEKLRKQLKETMKTNKSFLKILENPLSLTLVCTLLLNKKEDNKNSNHISQMVSKEVQSINELYLYQQILKMISHRAQSNKFIRQGKITEGQGQQLEADWKQIKDIYKQIAQLKVLEQLISEAFISGQIVIEKTKMRQKINNNQAFRDLKEFGLLKQQQIKKQDKSGQQIAYFEFIHLSFAQFLVAHSFYEKWASRKQPIIGLELIAKQISEKRHSSKYFNVIRYLTLFCARDYWKKNKSNNVKPLQTLWTCLTCNVDGVLEFGKERSLKLFIEVLQLSKYNSKVDIEDCFKDIPQLLESYKFVFQQCNLQQKKVKKFIKWYKFFIQSRYIPTFLIKKLADRSKMTLSQIKNNSDKISSQEIDILKIYLQMISYSIYIQDEKYFSKNAEDIKKVFLQTIVLPNKYLSVKTAAFFNIKRLFSYMPEGKDTQNDTMILTFLEGLNDKQTFSSAFTLLLYFNKKLAHFASQKNEIILLKVLDKLKDILMTKPELESVVLKSLSQPIFDGQKAKVFQIREQYVQYVKKLQQQKQFQVSNEGYLNQVNNIKIKQKIFNLLNFFIDSQQSKDQNMKQNEKPKIFQLIRRLNEKNFQLQLSIVNDELFNQEFDFEIYRKERMQKQTQQKNETMNEQFQRKLKKDYDELKKQKQKEITKILSKYAEQVKKQKLTQKQTINYYKDYYNGLIPNGYGKVIKNIKQIIDNMGKDGDDFKTSMLKAIPKIFKYLNDNRQNQVFNFYFSMKKVDLEKQVKFLDFNRKYLNNQTISKIIKKNLSVMQNQDANENQKQCAIAIVIKLLCQIEDTGQNRKISQIILNQLMKTNENIQKIHCQIKEIDQNRKESQAQVQRLKQVKRTAEIQTKQVLEKTTTEAKQVKKSSEQLKKSLENLQKTINSSIEAINLKIKNGQIRQEQLKQLKITNEKMQKKILFQLANHISLIKDEKSKASLVEGTEKFLRSQSVEIVAQAITVLTKSNAALTENTINKAIQLFESDQISIVKKALTLLFKNIAEIKNGDLQKKIISRVVNILKDEKEIEFALALLSQNIAQIRDVGIKNQIVDIVIDKITCKVNKQQERSVAQRAYNLLSKLIAQTKEDKVKQYIKTKAQGLLKGQEWEKIWKILVFLFKIWKDLNQLIQQQAIERTMQMLSNQYIGKGLKLLSQNIGKLKKEDIIKIVKKVQQLWFDEKKLNYQAMADILVLFSNSFVEKVEALNRIQEITSKAADLLKNEKVTESARMFLSVAINKNKKMDQNLKRKIIDLTVQLLQERDEKNRSNGIKSQALVLLSKNISLIRQNVKLQLAEKSFKWFQDENIANASVSFIASLMQEKSCLQLKISIEDLLNKTEKVSITNDSEASKKLVLILKYLLKKERIPSYQKALKRFTEICFRVKDIQIDAYQELCEILKETDFLDNQVIKKLKDHKKNFVGGNFKILVEMAKANQKTHQAVEEIYKQILDEIYDLIKQEGSQSKTFKEIDAQRKANNIDPYSFFAQQLLKKLIAVRLEDQDLSKQDADFLQFCIQHQLSLSFKYKNGGGGQIDTISIAVDDRQYIIKKGRIYYFKLLRQLLNKQAGIQFKNSKPRFQNNGSYGLKKAAIDLYETEEIFLRCVQKKQKLKDLKIDWNKAKLLRLTEEKESYYLLSRRNEFGYISLRKICANKQYQEDSIYPQKESNFNLFKEKMIGQQRDLNILMLIFEVDIRELKSDLPKTIDQIEDFLKCPEKQVIPIAILEQKWRLLGLKSLSSQLFMKRLKEIQQILSSNGLQQHHKILKEVKQLGKTEEQKKKIYLYFNSAYWKLEKIVESFFLVQEGIIEGNKAYQFNDEIATELWVQKLSNFVGENVEQLPVIGDIFGGALKKITDFISKKMKQRQQREFANKITILKEIFQKKVSGRSDRELLLKQICCLFVKMRKNQIWEKSEKSEQKEYLFGDIVEKSINITEDLKKEINDLIFDKISDVAENIGLQKQLESQTDKKKSVIMANADIIILMTAIRCFEQELMQKMKDIKREDIVSVLMQYFKKQLEYNEKERMQSTCMKRISKCLNVYKNLFSCPQQKEEAKQKAEQVQFCGRVKRYLLACFCCCQNQVNTEQSKKESSKQSKPQNEIKRYISEHRKQFQTANAINEFVQNQNLLQTNHSESTGKNMKIPKIETLNSSRSPLLGEGKKYQMISK